MLPFQNNLSQYIADLYASTSYYQPVYLFSNQENPWNPLSFPEVSLPASQLPCGDPENYEKAELPTKTKEKTRRHREKVERESSASCHSGEEDS